MPEYSVTITSELTAPVNDEKLLRMVDASPENALTVDDDEFSLDHAIEAPTAEDAARSAFAAIRDTIRIADVPAGAIVSLKVIEWSRYLKDFEES